MPNTRNNFTKPRPKLVFYLASLQKLASISNYTFLRLFPAFSIICFLALPAALSALPGYHEPWGKDSCLVSKERPSTMPPPPASLAGKIAESLILFNQNFISPSYGPRSHFRPTSSRYTLLCMRRYGFIKGFVLGCDRLLRENSDPWVYRNTIIDNISYKWEPSYRSLKEIKQQSR